MTTTSERERDRAAFDELCFYTLSHGDPAFIHQHVVDAFAAQHADESTKPIAITFALVGLYLHVEKDWTGRQVQKEHMRLAQHKREWPRFVAPADRGSVTVHDVLAAAPGPARDAAIHQWCESVWAAWQGARDEVLKVIER